MRTLILSFALLSSFAVADVTENTWQGALVDWECKQANSDQVCPAEAASKAFALSIDGGVLLHFDQRGNELAEKALREASGRVNTKATVMVSVRGACLRWNPCGSMAESANSP